MSTTLLERLFPASEHSNLRVTLKTTESFESNWNLSKKRPRPTEDDFTPLVKRRATSTNESELNIYKRQLALQNVIDDPSSMHMRSLSFDTLPEKRRSEADTFFLYQVRRALETSNDIPAQKSQRHKSEATISWQSGTFSQQRYRSRGTEDRVKSLPKSELSPAENSTGSDETSDFHSLIAVISDQVLNGVRLTTHERDLLEDLIPTSDVAPDVESLDNKVLASTYNVRQLEEPYQPVFQGFVIETGISDEEDDSASDFSNFFDLDEASEESPVEQPN